MKPQIKLAPDAATLYLWAAGLFRATALAAVGSKGYFTVALSGGSTPRSVYSILATEPAFRDDIPWDKCLFFWGDERHVPPESAESNFRMASETMLSDLPAGSRRCSLGKSMSARAAASSVACRRHISVGSSRCVTSTGIGPSASIVSPSKH